MKASVVLENAAVSPLGRDATVAVTDEAGAVLAQCSLWWRHSPTLPGERLGLIGQYSRADDGRDAAVLLLKSACEHMRQEGCTLAVGPMDGSTWQRYRFIIERGSEPPFFLEPDNPDEWPRDFLAAGFSVLSEYTSALSSDLTRSDARLERVEARLAGQGITIRPLRLDDYLSELRHIFTISSASFVENFLYTPIDEATFVAQYLPLRPIVRAELVMLVFDGDEPVGFVFAVPDLAEQRRGQTIKTVVLKTVAVIPGRAYAGIGNLLVSRVNTVARELGYTRVIHALMHESNNSKNIGARYAMQTFRRYALFSRPLRPA
jgi:GNAT superfamily N-acetyltransferase